MFEAPVKAALCVDTTAQSRHRVGTRQLCFSVSFSSNWQNLCLSEKGQFTLPTACSSHAQFAIVCSVHSAGVALAIDALRGCLYTLRISCSLLTATVGSTQPGLPALRSICPRLSTQFSLFIVIAHFLQPVLFCVLCNADYVLQFSCGFILLCSTRLDSAQSASYLVLKPDGSDRLVILYQCRTGSQYERFACYL